MNRLKELRKSKRLLQKDVAKHIGVAVSTYSYWENGTYEIDFKTLDTISKFYDVSIDYLLGYEKSISTKFIETKNRLILSLAKKNIKVEDLEKLSPDDIDILLSLIEKFLKEKK